MLGVLFAVAITAPVRPANPASTQTASITSPSPAQSAGVASPQPPAPTAHSANVVQADTIAPEMRDLGSFSSSRTGIKGHLSTSWSEKLIYELVMKPSDPAQHEAFAATVANPPRPFSVNFELKNSAGISLCDQEVVLKYDPRKWLDPQTDLSRLESQEQARETSHDIFHDEIGKDGKVESISSQGTMPCTKKAYDSAASWSFLAHFPDVQEQTAFLHRQAGTEVATTARPEFLRPVAKPHPTRQLSTILSEPAALKPAVAAAAAEPVEIATIVRPEPAEVVTPTPTPAVSQPTPDFRFQVEGDDEIVDIDTAQKSIETSAGKTFIVEGTFDKNADQGTSVHYRCNQDSHCTLAFADATVLRATMRIHHVSTLPTELSMNDSEDVPSGLAGSEPMDH